jgi:RNA polymerase sigma factor (sigma-70 family)
MELRAQRVSLSIRKYHPGGMRWEAVANNGMDAAIRRLDSLFRVGSLAGLSDKELLDRLIATDRVIASTAFESLIRRHGPMVLAACRGVLRNEHDAEDAFQTTFLVLGSRVHTIRSANSLGPWLHRVALRASNQARAQAARRRDREAARAEVMSMERQGPENDPEREELTRLIHQEVDRLPERHRVVVVLCDLQRESYQQATARLRVPVGKVRSRLSRARERLRRRIVRRGIVLPAGALVANLAGAEASAGVPAHLVASTASLANLSAAHAITAGAASTVAIGNARRLGNALAVSSFGKAGLAVILMGVGVSLTVVGSGLKSSTNRGVALRAGPAIRDTQPTGVPGLAVKTSEQQPAPSDGSSKTKPDPARSRAELARLLEEARRSATDLSESRSRARMFLAIATAYAKAGDVPAARATIQEAVQVADTIEDLSNRVYILEDIAVIQVDSKDREAALATVQHVLEVINTIGDEHQRNSARMYIVRTFSRAGDLDTALRIVRELPESFMKSRALAYALEGLRRDRPGRFDLNASECLRTIAFVEARAGFSAEAIQTAEAIIEPKWKNSALAMIAESMAKQGQIKAAIQLVGKIDDANVKSPALQGITLGQAESGDIDGAVEWARSRTTPRARADALFGIVQAIAKR